jgi:hypothetical protein
MLRKSRYNQNAMQKSVDISMLETIFWDIDFDALSWNENRDFIIQRVLTHGNLEMIRWLRKTMGNAALATWIQDHQGRGLSPRQLRYWEVILELPVSMVDQWVETKQQSTWQRRMA